MATVVVALVAAACSGDDASAESSGPLRLNLATVDGEPGVVQVILANASDEPVAVVRPFVTPHFVLLRVNQPDGSEIPFDGPYPRLEPLTEAHVVTLAPGESVVGQFDLAEHFALLEGPVTVSAEYRARQIHHGGLAMTVDPDAPVVAEPIEVEAAP